MVFWTIASWIFIPTGLQEANFSAFQGVFLLSLPEMKHFMNFDLSKALSAAGLTVIFTLFFVDIFDSTGTLVSVANVNGSFLSLDLKFFFPNKKSNGSTFRPGPIE